MIRHTPLTPEQIHYLADEYHLTTDGRSFPASPVPVAHLLDPARCAAYLDRVGSAIQSPSRAITASAVSKRYAYLTVAPALYAMSIYNKGLDFLIGNCSLQSPVGANDHWLPGVSLIGTGAALRVSEPVAGERHEWRDEILRRLFAGNIAPLYRTLSNTASIPLPILWENAAVRLYPVYDDPHEQPEEIEEVTARKRDDFEYLIHTAPASIFGEKKNPLAQLYSKTKKKRYETKSVRIRATCCLYYKVGSSDGSTCLNCPITR